MKALVIVGAAVAGANVASASLPAAVADGEYGLAEVGSGKLSFFGFSIYDASLWTADGEFAGFVAGRPVALSLWYKRAFSRSELLDITRKAWERLGTGSQAQRAGWLEQLEAVWNDVDPGDNMTAVVLPGRETRFYDQTGFKGRIDDPELGPAFLGIWLDRESVVGDLRAELLGLK
ncbi:MAG TPA: chalcone isomerase family protein [Steroidobacteraceae bacterium]|nr:chalcone isomerase family protein [Steroidobacteraceae bacterium]